MKHFFKSIIICLLISACTPIPNISHAHFMSDNKTEVKVCCYNGDQNVTQNDLRLETFLVDGKFIEKPNPNSVTCRDFKIEEEQWRYDVQIINQQYPLYVSACEFIINDNGAIDFEKYNISSKEIYDSIASQYPEYIGKYIVKIEDGNITQTKKVVTLGVKKGVAMKQKTKKNACIINLGTRHEKYAKRS